MCEMDVIITEFRRYFDDNLIHLTKKKKKRLKEMHKGYCYFRIYMIYFGGKNFFAH